MSDDERELALAEAMHFVSETCNANYAIPLDECGAYEADILDARFVLARLRAYGWTLSADTAGTVELGL